VTTYLAAAIARHHQPGNWLVLDTFRVDLDAIGIRLTGLPAYHHRFTLVQYAIDCVRVNRWPDNRRTDSLTGYVRQAFIRELTREVS
jgi:hypothetical protein